MRHPHTVLWVRLGAWLGALLLIVASWLLLWALVMAAAVR
jgi:hypothetical protein